MQHDAFWPRWDTMLPFFVNSYETLFYAMFAVQFIDWWVEWQLFWIGMWLMQCSLSLGGYIACQSPAVLFLHHLWTSAVTNVCSEGLRKKKTIILQLYIVKSCPCFMAATVTLPLYPLHHAHVVQLIPFLQVGESENVLLSLIFLHFSLCS